MVESLSAMRAKEPIPPLPLPLLLVPWRSVITVKTSLQVIPPPSSHYQTIPHPPSATVRLPPPPNHPTPSSLQPTTPPCYLQLCCTSQTKLTYYTHTIHILYTYFQTSRYILNLLIPSNNQQNKHMTMTPHTSNDLMI